MVELGKSDTKPFHYRHNIEVNLTDHMLTIKGEKKAITDRSAHRGLFVRTIDLPKEVHSGKVKGSFKNGILEVRLLKTEEVKAKEVKVKIDLS